MLDFIMFKKHGKENYPTLVFLKDFWRYTFGFHKELVLFSLLAIIPYLQGLLPQVLWAKLVDGLTAKNISSEAVSLILIIWAANGFLRIFLRLRSKFFLNRLSEEVRYDTRQKALKDLFDFDLEWHESQSSGKKLTVVSKGADSLRGMIRFIGRGGAEILVNIVGVLLIFLKIGPKYFVTSVLNIFFYLFIYQLLNKKLVGKWHKLNKEHERVVGKNYDYFSNIGLVKKLGISNQISKMMFRKEWVYAKRTITVSKEDHNKWIYIQSISQLFFTLNLLFIVLDITSGKISIGSFFIFTGYISRLQEGLSEVAAWMNDLMEMKLSFWRLVQLLKSGKRTTDIGKKLFPDDFLQIKFENAYFSYKTSTGIIKGLNLTIKKGEKVGFVGESGSGKSTAVKLLLRLYLLNGGRIFFGKTGINEIKTEELRANVAIVPQESEIFNTTFKENITVVSGVRKFDNDLYSLSLKIAECKPILEKIRNNHRTLLGEKGVKLSGGERQRLGIARAIYKNSPVMIFDESTSSLDSKTEKKILDNLEKYLKDKTIVWVAHRLSTLRFTDRIFVFDKGKIAESGSFSSLITRKGLFYQLWQLQKKTKMR